MTVGRLSVLLLTLGALTAPTHSATTGPLTFQQRVKAEEALLRLSYAHQLGASRRFEEAIPRAAIEDRVRTYLRESAALEQVWDAPITEAMLEAELQRMARQSRMPDRLLEMFAALDDDPVVVQECLARPLLADRLARGLFAHDAKIHAASRSEATAIRDGIASGRIDPGAGRSDRLVAEILRRGPRAESSPVDDHGRVSLDDAQFDRMSASVPAALGTPGPVEEQADSFMVQVPLARDKARLVVATYLVPKKTWDEWWAQTAARLEPAAPPVAASGAFRLPRPTGKPWPGAVPDENSWNNGSLDDVPDPRRLHTATWTGTEMIVWGGENASNIGYRYNPTTDAWTKMSQVGAPPPRFEHAAVWTGSQLLIWGGRTETSALDTGYRYDPAGDSWTPMAAVGAPQGRYGHSAVWTGSSMIIWGGRTLTPFVILGDGAVYDPIANSWTPISGTGAPSARVGQSAIWTGQRMVIWGGANGTCFSDGGRYDPGTDTWSPTSLLNAPPARSGHAAVWADGMMLIWSGANDTIEFGSGARYDPVNDLWSTMSTVNAPPGHLGVSAVWTGHEMFVWGGTLNGSFVYQGARYDPAADVWTPSLASGPRNHDGQTAVWTGSQMIVWGGTAYPGNSGGRYDPVLDQWTPTANAAAGAPAGRNGHTAVWTGSVMIVWGGDTATGGFLNAGGRYDPATDAWTPTSLTGAPERRYLHTAVWAGDRMVIWGGFGAGFTCLRSGGRYDPLLDSWAGTPPFVLDDFACIGRTAVWTGHSVIIWGGTDSQSTRVNTGFLYDPVANTTKLTAVLNAPSARSEHTAVWTGSRMVIWGGVDASGRTSTGGQYDPAGDTWTPVAMVQAPSGRSAHTAVWTGTRMVVWGGYGGPLLNDGGLYDPATDQWKTMTTLGAPAARDQHQAVWTGEVMVVWGGTSGNGSAPGGGLYDPERDVWAPSSLLGEPTERVSSTAVWSGSDMIVWGGMTDLDTGGRFRACSFRTYYPDGDGDGVGASSPAVDACGQPAGYAAAGGDCNDLDATVWAAPGEVRGLMFTDATTLAWSPPTIPGAAVVRYDVLRSNAAADFQTSAACIASDLALTSTADAERPVTGQVFYYLIRAANGCPAGEGPLGTASDGTPIPGRACP